MRHSVFYTFMFAAVVCVICAIGVSSSAVALKERQKVNQKLDKQKNVLMAAGIFAATDKPSRAQIDEAFQNVKPVIVDLAKGVPSDAVDPLTYDQQAAKNDPAMSAEAPPNASVIKRLPTYATVYHVLDKDGHVEMVVLPIEGYGLWSTLYGFLALDSDGKTIHGITYYQHGETPGLGGEVDNPQWKSLWRGRKAYESSDWKPQITVIKGQAGPPADDPFRVDGLSGATITSRGVSNMLHFWLGESGFAPYLNNFQQSGA